MGNGTGSTLVLHPTGLNDIAFGLRGGEPMSGTTPYIVPLQTLDFNEELRYQMTYANTGTEGGSAISHAHSLAPVVFRVVIKTATRAALIAAYNALQRALTNRKGGTLEYKPEGLSSGALSTFYHYVQSGLPQIVDAPRNRWDAAPTSDGMYTLTVDVQLMTQPIATSDPDSPVTVAALGTNLANCAAIAIDADDLKGALPALLRITATPHSSQNLGRLIMFDRHDGDLDNLTTILEAEDAAQIYPSVAWTEVSLAAASGGAYMKCVPTSDGNDFPNGLRFTIPHPEDHHGRVALFGVCYDDEFVTGVWTHQVRVQVGNVVIDVADDARADMLHQWCLVYVGEFDLPPVDFSDLVDGYDAGPYIDWYATRVSGSRQFRLDAILLVFIQDEAGEPTAVDIQCANDDGVPSSDLLLIENYPSALGPLSQRVYVLDATDKAFKRTVTTAPRGTLLTLDPAVDHKLVFVNERAWSLSFYSDNFADYEATCWRLIEDFEDADDWTLAAGTSKNNDTSVFVLGTQSLVGVGTGMVLTMTKAVSSMDLTIDGRFTNDDYIAIAVHLVDYTDVIVINVWLATSATGGSYRAEFSSGLANGWNFLTMKRSAMTLNGSPDWSDIDMIVVDTMITNSDPVRFDALYIIRADPDNAATPNATGVQYNLQPIGHAWVVAEETTGIATLSCLDAESGVEKTALLDVVTPNDVQFRARVLLKDEGLAGIVWRAGNDTLTEGAEDCYCALLDTGSDVVRIREYANGAYANRSSPAFSCAPSVWYVMGVLCKGSTYTVYATAASNLSDDDDVFDDAYYLGFLVDATLSSGQCGVMSVSTLGRFTDISIEQITDRFVAADEVTLTGQALWRTIAPFGE